MVQNKKVKREEVGKEYVDNIASLWKQHESNMNHCRAEYQETVRALWKAYHTGLGDLWRAHCDMLTSLEVDEEHLP